MQTEPIFEDRAEAGRIVAQELRHYADRPADVVVLALPRGGVPVGLEIAKALRVPMDVFQVRKLGVPGHEELAMGAIASGGIRVLNQLVVDSLGISPKVIEKVAAREQAELERRERDYRDDRPPPDVSGKIVILVDDGLATGATMRAAAEALRSRNAARIVVAVPTAAAQTCQEFRSVVDEVVCAAIPEPFRAVGVWYEHFPQLTDGEVRELLRQAPTVGVVHRSAPEIEGFEPPRTAL